MKIVSKSALFCLMAFITISHSSILASKPLRMEVTPGGYKFYSSYKLHRFSESINNPSEIKVKLIIGPNTTIEKRIDGRVIPSAFFATVKCKIDGKAHEVVERYFPNQTKAISKTSLSSSAEWFPEIENFFLKVADTHFKKIMPRLRNEKKEWLQLMKKRKSKSLQNAPSDIRLKRLPGCKLKNTYSIRIRSALSDSSKLPPSIIVNLTTRRELVSNYDYKKMLVVTAAFSTNNREQIGRHESIVKFAVTKKGLKEVGRIDIEPTSVWYPWVKKIAKRCAMQYTKIRKTDDHAIHLLDKELEFFNAESVRFK